MKVKHLRDSSPSRAESAPETHRVLIVGGPKSGKTTLGRRHRARSTDELIEGRAFDQQVAAAAGWMEMPGPWAIEGVTAVRALRQWLRDHPGERPPVDRVIYLRQPYVPLSRHQDAMRKGIETVFREIEPELRRHGVEVVE